MKNGKQELNEKKIVVWFKILTHVQLKDPLNRLIYLIKFHNFVSSKLRNYYMSRCLSLLIFIYPKQIDLL